MMTNVHNDSLRRAMESLDAPAMETLRKLIQFDSQNAQINQRMLEVCCLLDIPWAGLAVCRR